MTTNLAQLLGGLGLFLLGMMVMTDGLRGLAGDHLHRWLARFTNSPVSGAVTGAATTAVLQSSSATTVAAVGFVSAGLLTYVQALGVVFGANLGTTVTGWLVALLGLKLQIGQLVFPLILFGALLRLFARGRWRHTGFALAGFGLVFQGIAVLQAGMAAYQGLVTPADFPADDWGGRLQLVAIGIAITLVTQSSSAGVATALTAVYTGTISFPQAAALVIGMDVGTTITAVVATLGGSVDTRRTGYSHVVYNLLTAAGALLLLDIYAAVWHVAAPGALSTHAELALVGFHSLFNLLGVMLVLPFVAAFARLMHRLVPEPHDPVVDRLDDNLLRTPDLALDNVVQILSAESDALLTVVDRLLDGGRPGAARLGLIALHLDAVHSFVDRIHLQAEQRAAWRRLTAAFHLLDHLQRLHERCDEEPERAEPLTAGRVPGDLGTAYAGVLGELRGQLKSGASAEAAKVGYAAADRLSVTAPGLRDAIMADVVRGEIDVPEANRRLAGVRWLRRVSRHIAVIADYLSQIREIPVKPSDKTVNKLDTKRQ